MLTSDQKHLQIFDRFQSIKRDPDPLLDGRPVSVGGGGIVNVTQFGTPSFITASMDSTSSTSWGTNENYFVVSGSKDSKFKNLISKLKRKPKEVIKAFARHMFNPSQFFEEIKGSLLTIHELRGEAIVAVQELINQAKTNGQVAFAETLEDEKYRIEKEIILVKEGFVLFVSEDDVIKFSKNSTRALKLDWIKNYCRLIPSKIQNELVRANKLGIFDNYVILHYDPEDTNAKLTKKEEEAKKDPILFGVFKGSSRLYFIGDWVDQFCNLKLDVMLNSIGESKDNRVLNEAYITKELIEKCNCKNKEVRPEIKKVVKKAKKLIDQIKKEHVEE